VPTYLNRQQTSSAKEYDIKFPVPTSSFVFMYDDVMKGFPNFEELIDARFMTYALTKEYGYDMHDFGEKFYCACVEGGKGRIAGEVYKVDAKTLKSLDSFQNNGKLFERKLVKVVGFKKKCWMYTYIPDAEFGLIGNYFIDKQNRRLYDWRSHKTNESTYSLVKATKSLQPSALDIWKASHEVRLIGRPLNRDETTEEKNKKEEEIVPKEKTPFNITSLIKVTKVYNPNITLEDGSMINKDKLAYDILSFTDYLEEMVKETGGDKVKDMLDVIEEIRQETRKLSVTSEVGTTTTTEAA